MDKLDKSLAAQMSMSSSAPGPRFWLAEKTELRKTETDERIKEYEARVSTDRDERTKITSAAASSVMGLKTPGRISANSPEEARV